MAEVNVDLHNHGLIGFEPTWLRVQGYAGKNILKEMADAAMNNDIHVTAVISESDRVDDEGIIMQGSLHDRIGWLRETYLNGLNAMQGYEADTFGSDSIMVKKGRKSVILLSGITPIVREGALRYDHLVIGNNRVPNFMSLSETIDHANDVGLLHGLEHPTATAHYGLGLQKAQEAMDGSDFVEGQNAQLRWGKLTGWLPVLKNYSRKRNHEAQTFAKAYNKPWIATSDAHRISDVGKAFITFDHQTLDRSGEDKLLASLKSNVHAGNFYIQEGHVSALDWIRQGVTFHRHKAAAQAEGLEAISL